MAQEMTVYERILNSNLTKGTLPAFVVQKIREDKLRTVGGVLGAYKSAIGISKILKQDTSLISQGAAFDLLWQACQQLSTGDRALLFTLCSRSFGLDLEVCTYGDEDFEKNCSNNIELKNREAEQRNKFVKHPFIEAFRNEFRYVDDVVVLDQLAKFWNEQNNTAFLYFLEAQFPMRISLKSLKQDSGEDDFITKLAEYEKLNLVVRFLDRGTSTPYSDNEYTPYAAVVISNIPQVEPTLSQEPAQSGWVRADNSPSFSILTASGHFTSLERYMRASLKQRDESIAFGPYHFHSHSDTTYATAANVMATLHNFVRVPSNTLIHAQDRVRTEIESLESKALGPIYANRFLRTKSLSSLMMAINVALNPRSTTYKNTVGYKETTKLLLIHGLMSHALYLGGLPTIKNEAGTYVVDTIGIKEVHEGFREGVFWLKDQMEQLLDGSDRETEALSTYERERGFHPDVMLMPVQDRKRLAFKDMSDLMLAALTNHVMFEAVYYPMASPENAEKYSTFSPEAKEILSTIPIRDIFSLFVKAGDVTNFMRLKTYIESQFSSTQKNEEPMLRDFNRQINRAGYNFLKKFTIKDLNKLPVDTIVHDSGKLFLRVKNSPQYKTVEQIVENASMTEAVAAMIFLHSVTFPEGAQEEKNRQSALVQEFILEKLSLFEVKSMIDELQIPKEDQPVWVEMMKGYIKHAISLDDKNAGNTPAQVGDNKEILIRAFDEAVSGPKPKPAFWRPVAALQKVAHLFAGLKKGPR